MSPLRRIKINKNEKIKSALCRERAVQHRTQRHCERREARGRRHSLVTTDGRVDNVVVERKAVDEGNGKLASLKTKFADFRLDVVELLAGEPACAQEEGCLFFHLPKTVAVKKITRTSRTVSMGIRARQDGQISDTDNLANSVNFSRSAPSSTRSTAARN